MKKFEAVIGIVPGYCNAFIMMMDDFSPSKIIANLWRDLNELNKLKGKRFAPAIVRDCRVIHDEGNTGKYGEPCCIISGNYIGAPELEAEWEKTIKELIGELKIQLKQEYVLLTFTEVQSWIELV